MAGTALISVSDKTGLIDFVKELVQLDYKLVSTGGTAKVLRAEGFDVKDVSDVTGFPEMMDGRVKTLHPKIHGGILADRDNPEHVQALKEHNIVEIDLIIVNLYPFKQTVSKPNVALEEAIENIDIGGPSLIRAGAKNHPHVTVVVDPKDYHDVIVELKSKKVVSLELKRRLMARAFAHTAAYDALIADYFSKRFDTDYPFTDKVTLTYDKASVLRYGENPHQQAALYIDPMETTSCVSKAEKLWGKEISHNNYLDADAAWELVREFSEPTVAIIKHTNPCGLASADNIPTAFRNAKEGDPLAAFGGIVAVNRVIDEADAEVILEKGNFFEVILAPDFTPTALEMITQRKGWGQDVRLLKLGSAVPAPAGMSTRSITGGILFQSRDTKQTWETDQLHCVTEKKPTPEQMEDLKLAWIAVKHVKSNAIVLAKKRQLIGVGAGQMSRVQSTRLALEQAGEKAQGAVLASDAFFPFPDSIELASAQGIIAVVQPGGSKKDNEVIEACNRLGIAMVLTGYRHFRH